MKKFSSILVVDDDVDVLLAAELLLKGNFDKVSTLSSPSEIINTLNSYNYDLVLLDMNYTRDSSSGKEGLFWLKKILEVDDTIGVLCMTAYGEIDLAVEAIKQGALDFLTKPWDNDELVAKLSSSMKHLADKRELANLRNKNLTLNKSVNSPSHKFIGKSKSMQHVFEMIDKIAKTDANVLITGESGTGKELAAYAIHNQSLRAKSSLIKLDMGAIPTSLFESEMFGHTKGAFTGATQDKPGRFEVASGGTLFLDEIANLSLEHQAKLLSVLQNREITRVGSTKPFSIDIRLICATNEELSKLISSGVYREDLYYRINTFEIHIPALRERRDDIPHLLNYYLDLFSKKYRKHLRIPDKAVNDLQGYDWPGNIRELAHSVERAILLCDDGEIDTNHIINRQNYEPKDNTSELDHPLKIEDFNLANIELETIKSALSHHKGNVTKAAKSLGITRGSLYRRMEKHNL
ncbi:MAG: sigma-54-dependent Fis family transcriptional regulator [Idiomarinaceae bacterium]|jgi:DNA-binding NtrC family response regulator|nr:MULTISPECIES: sigma-54 dependent transcriptional regulator [unclassified Idiomarina]NWO03282.1 sigma-54-dependent Fis family transcriptional regulator [Idiomarinaceae bacterium]|tara:strand:+ start:6088 stop:7479 length:1392 start_codon:yes stop_codon:yes gene_type:complete